MKYLSPTSIMLYRRNKRDFYLQYVLGVSRFPQTKAMSVGSAFDYLVKKEISADLGVEFSMESGVEEANRDFAYTAGEKIVKIYKSSGAYDHLMSKLSGKEVKMEQKVIKEVFGVPLCGIPDLIYDDVILDFKVNGYCGKSARPKRGYIRSWPGGEMHKSVIPDGDVDVSCCLDDIAVDWATQLCIYAWLGRAGDTAWIEQIVCNDDIKIYSNVHKISDFFQNKLKREVIDIWNSLDELNEEYADLADMALNDPSFLEMMR